MKKQHKTRTLAGIRTIKDATTALAIRWCNGNHEHFPVDVSVILRPRRAGKDGLRVEANYLKTTYSNYDLTRDCVTLGQLRMEDATSVPTIADIAGALRFAGSTSDDRFLPGVFHGVHSWFVRRVFANEPNNLVLLQPWLELIVETVAEPHRTIFSIDSQCDVGFMLELSGLGAEANTASIRDTLTDHEWNNEPYFDQFDWALFEFMISDVRHMLHGP